MTQSRDVWIDLTRAMDAMQPQWFIAYANEQELKDFAYAINTKGSIPERAIESLRSHVVRRLDMPLRAAVHASMVKEV